MHHLVKFKAGDKIKFKSEKQRYTIWACDERYLICKKPFNARRTYLYTIVDLYQEIRGADNIVGGLAYDTKEECEESLRWLQKGMIEISHKNRIKLDIEKYD